MKHESKHLEEKLRQAQDNNTFLEGKMCEFAAMAHREKDYLS
jgi:hypothetical protein